MGREGEGEEGLQNHTYRENFCVVVGAPTQGGAEVNNLGLAVSLLEENRRPCPARTGVRGGGAVSETKNRARRSGSDGRSVGQVGGFFLPEVARALRAEKILAKVKEVTAHSANFPTSQVRRRSAGV